MKVFTTDHWKVSGIAEADVKNVFKLMVEIHRTSVRALLHLKQGGSNVEVSNSHYFEIDPELKTITIRGGYWYEGIFSAEEISEGTRISYKVNNIGPGSNILPRLSKWLVPIWQYKFPSKMKVEMKNYLQEIGKKLNCKTYPEFKE